VAKDHSGEINQNRVKAGKIKLKLGNVAISMLLLSKCSRHKTFI
jgi:hypothetical protein